MRVALNVRNTEYVEPLADQNYKVTARYPSDVPFTLSIHFVFGERDIFMINIDPEI